MVGMKARQQLPRQQSQLPILVPPPTIQPSLKLLRHPAMFRHRLRSSSITTSVAYPFSKTVHSSGSLSKCPLQTTSVRVNPEGFRAAVTNKLLSPPVGSNRLVTVRGVGKFGTLKRVHVVPSYRYHSSIFWQTSCSELDGCGSVSEVTRKKAQMS